MLAWVCGRGAAALRLAAFAVPLAAGLFVAAGARAQDRVALVLAAEDYQKLQKSPIGVKRGADIADALKADGFDVLVNTNPTNAGARASLRDFSEKLAGADLALVVVIGHGTGTQGQSFFLPTNAEIGRATDLMSRGLSVTNLAQIVGRAKAGGVFVLTSAPTFDPPVDGLESRPQFAGEVEKNVVVVFSHSQRVPVSRVDAVSTQAAEALAKALRQPQPTLPEAVKAAASGDIGLVLGTAPDIALQPSPHAAPPQSASVSQPIQPIQPAPPATAGSDTQARLDAERRAREVAEQQARQEQVKAEQARLETQKAQADLLKAQADAKRALAEAERAQAEAEKVRADADQARQQAQQMAEQTKAQQADEQARLDAMEREHKLLMGQTGMAKAETPVDEGQLGQKQRQIIQERLRDLGLYTGKIDSVLGPLTREAIMGYQRSRGAAVTGFLTPDQYQDLTGPKPGASAKPVAGAASMPAMGDTMGAKAPKP